MNFSLLLFAELFSIDDTLSFAGNLITVAVIDWNREGIEYSKGVA